MRQKETNMSESKFNGGSAHRDAPNLLCWCDDGISYHQFVEFTLEHPEMGFSKLCDELHVGKRCTACLP